jgi:hypothetical protein
MSYASYEGELPDRNRSWVSGLDASERERLFKEYGYYINILNRITQRVCREKGETLPVSSNVKGLPCRVCDAEIPPFPARWVDSEWRKCPLCVSQGQDLPKLDRYFMGQFGGLDASEGIRLTLSAIYETRARTSTANNLNLLGGLGAKGVATSQPLSGYAQAELASILRELFPARGGAQVALAAIVPQRASQEAEDNIVER